MSAGKDTTSFKAQGRRRPTDGGVLEKEVKFPSRSAAAVKLLTLNCDLPVGKEEKFPHEDQQIWTLLWGLKTTAASFRRAGDSSQNEI